MSSKNTCLPAAAWLVDGGRLNEVNDLKNIPHTK